MPRIVRVAGHGDKLYLDLANASWQAVEIDAAGWRIVEPCPVRFRRAKAMMPLPTPTAGGDIAGPAAVRERDARRLAVAAGMAGCCIPADWSLSGSRLAW